MKIKVEDYGFSASGQKEVKVQVISTVDDRIKIAAYFAKQALKNRPTV